MDEKLKYRLVGASVILALAIFFLPMILDSEKYRSQLQSQIPEAPGSNNSESSEARLQSETSSFEATGAVEQGPLVINLDDSVEQEQTVDSKNNSNTKPQHSVETQKDESQKTSKPTEQKSQQESSDSIDDVASTAKTTPKQTDNSLVQEDTRPKPQDMPQPETQPKAEPEPKSEQSTESELAFSDSAWLIQIGSFSNKENATRLVNQLRDEGYRAYQRVGDSYARVYVGPYPVKGEAETRTSALEKMIGSKVKVIEFDPKQH